MKQAFLLSICAFLIQPSSAQSWEELPDIPVDLTYPVVVVLDSQIHIMGGGESGGASSSHYAFNPETMIWTEKAATPYLAQQPGGAAINGKIHYMGGGFPNSGTPLDKHYAYDPGSDSWSLVDTMPAVRVIHKVATINDEIFIMGGQPDKFRCESYDVSNSTWDTKSNLPDANFWYAAVTEADGTIYRFGGGGYTAPSSAAHKYNASSDTWTSLPSLPVGLHGTDAATVGDHIYITGGYYNGTSKDEFRRFNIQTETYEDLTPMPSARSYHNTVAFDDCIYVLGGYKAGDDSVGYSMIRYCPYDTIVEPPNAVNAPEQESWKVYACGTGCIAIESNDIESSNATLEIRDLSGRIVYQESIAVQQGHSQIEIPAGSCSANLYLVKVQTDTKSLVQKIWLD